MSMRRVIISLECSDVDEKLEFPCQQGVRNNFTVGAKAESSDTPGKVSSHASAIQKY